MTTILGELHRRPAISVVARRSTILFIAGAAVIPVLWGVLLIETSGVTTAGYELTRLEETRDDWRASNANLESEMARLASIDRVDREARAKLKMIPSGATNYVASEIAPSRSQVSAPPVSQREFGKNAVATTSQDGWQSFLAFLARLGEFGTSK